MWKKTSIQANGELPNNIIHPTLPNGIAFVMGCFGRVMMSVGQNPSKDLLSL